MALIAASSIAPIPTKADLGDADFPIGKFNNAPQSYHDAWCRKLKNECRVRIQGQNLWVEGQGGIKRSQFLNYRYDWDGEEFYNYITYKDKKGQKRDALFLFVHPRAQAEFIRAFFRWKDQVEEPYPNFRLPASQGPQETHGRDKSNLVPMNPYDNPPITDWSKRTTHMTDACERGVLNAKDKRCQKLADWSPSIEQ